MTGAPGAIADRRTGWIRGACRWMLMSEVANVKRGGARVAIIEPEAADLRCMGRPIGSDAVDERRCPAVVEQVYAFTLARLRAERIPGLRDLGDEGGAVVA